MSDKSQALRLINDLVADFRDPGFVWQVVSLVACIGLAALIAHWWRGRRTEGEGRLSDASSRLAFPLTGMVLTGIAIATLGSLIHVNLLKLAMPLLGSMALVRELLGRTLGRMHAVGALRPFRHRPRMLGGRLGADARRTVLESGMLPAHVEARYAHVSAELVVSGF